MPIRAILFDLGHVVVDFDHAKICRLLASHCPHTQEEVYQIIFGGGIEKKYDQGLLTSDEFYRQVSYRLDAKLAYERFAEIWGDNFTLNADVAELLPRLTPDIRRFIISNTNELHWHYIRRFALVQEYFPQRQQWILSFVEKTRKPDVRIFQEAIRRAGVAACEIVYIDDIPAYTEVFQSLGGEAIVYDCRFQPRQYLESRLSAYGVFVTAT